MEEPDPILLFQHCQKGVNILYLDPPEMCPLCRRDTATTPSEIPPFRLPSPFQSAQDAPFSVVVRPTVGSFLRDYANNADLHVGITDSKGTVYEYDSSGVHVSSQSWSQCLAIKMIDKYDSRWSHNWDDSLRQFSLLPTWSASRYSDRTHHCYDFVLRFLLVMGIEKILPCVQDGTKFCVDQVVPKTTQAARYISLYRRLLQEGLIIQGRSDSDKEDQKLSIGMNSPSGFKENSTHL